MSAPSSVLGSAPSLEAALADICDVALVHARRIAPMSRISAILTRRHSSETGKPGDLQVELIYETPPGSMIFLPEEEARRINSIAQDMLLCLPKEVVGFSSRSPVSSIDLRAFPGGHRQVDLKRRWPDHFPD